MSHLTQALASKSWLQWSAEPFAGAVHDFTQPLRKRADMRRYCGPYYLSPRKPGAGLGFYTDSRDELQMARHGACVGLRLQSANDFLGYSRKRFTNGYYCDDYQDCTLKPIVALLPHGRGYLAGWVMGAGMCGSLDPHIWDDASDAAHAAHDMAEHDAEREREYRAECEGDTE